MIRRALAVTAIFLLATISVYLLRPSAPEIPSVDPIGLEAAVSTKIDRLRGQIAREPDSPAGWGRLGRTFHAHGFTSQAVLCYRQAAALDPGDYRWPYLSALATRADDPQTALEFLWSAVALKPAHAAVFINLAELQLANGRAAEARKAFSRALEIEPDSVHARYGVAKILFLEQKLDEAAGLLQEVLSIAHHHGESHALLAQILGRLGDEGKAEEHELLARAFWIPTRPADPILDSMEAEAVDSQSLAQRGARLVNRGDYEAAEALFRQVLEMRSANPVDYTNLGTALAGQGRHQDALRQYRRALELSPDHVKALNDIAIALVNLNRHDEALEFLKRALAIDGSNAETHYNLGRVQSMLSDHAAAERHYRRALDLNPAHASALEFLGDSLISQDRFEEAVASWRRALLLDPKNVALRYHLASRLIEHGSHREAVQTLRTGLELVPDAGHLTSLLAWQLASAPVEALRDPREALALARRLHRRFPDDPAVNQVLAASLAATGDFEAAGRHGVEGLRLQRIDPDDPTHPEARRVEGYRRGVPYRQPAPGELP